MERSSLKLVFAVMVVMSMTSVWSQNMSGGSLINSHDNIIYLNRLNDANYSWTAGVNEFFNSFTYDDASAAFGNKIPYTSESRITSADREYSVADADIPNDFDARTSWPGLIHPIQNQQLCGSSWAFTTAGVLADRVAIASGKPSPLLSAEDLVSCDPFDKGCNGALILTAWQYLQDTGVVSDRCLPYSAGNGSAQTCPEHCVNGEPWKKTKAKNSYTLKGEVELQKEIMTNGPVVVTLHLYKSLFSYKKGVYQKHWYESLSCLGAHAAKAIGWGTEHGVPYWLVANSWGTGWGLDGYFKIKRGVDECGIEEFGPPYAGMPAMSDEELLLV